MLQINKQVRRYLPSMEVGHLLMAGNMSDVYPLQTDAASRCIRDANSTIHLLPKTAKYAHMKGRKYTVESFQGLSPQGEIVVGVLITRTE